MLSFHIFIAMIAGATVTAALQRPNHLAFPLFFLLLLALLSGMVVASFSASADVELLRHRILGLRHEVSDLTSLNGLVGSEASDMGSSPPATKTPGTSSPRNDFATQHPHPFANRAREASMPQDRFTFVDAGTPHEPSKIEVRKDGQPIGRILHVAESQHMGAIYRFYRGQTSIDLKTAAQYSDLDELKKWIRETQ